MLKIQKSKKGFNNMFLLGLIATILLVSSVIVPMVQTEFTGLNSTVDSDGLRQDLSDDIGEVDSISVVTVPGTLLRMVFWDPGDSLALPVWLDLFYSLLGILLLVILFVMVRGGGS